MFYFVAVCLLFLQVVSIVFGQAGTWAAPAIFLLLNSSSFFTGVLRKQFRCVSRFQKGKEDGFAQANNGY